MQTAQQYDEAIAEAGTSMAAPSKCFNGELMVWILTELKAILFRADGSKRNSLLVSKGKLLVFALALAAKVGKCLFDNRRRRINLPDIQP